MSRLLCFGDLHLGAGAEYGAKPGDRLDDQAMVLNRILEIAVEREVDGILVAGDIFEGPQITPEQFHTFACFTDEADEYDIPILGVVGNGKHDAAMRSVNGLELFNHLSGIAIRSYPTWDWFADCAVVSLPWVSPAKLVAERGRTVSRDEINAETGPLLVEVADDLYRTVRAVTAGRGGAHPIILLLHWSLSGASLPTGLPVDLLREPVIPTEELQRIGYDYIVAGHIHKAQQVGDDGFYVGSPLPLNFGEAGGGHGVWILDTDEREIVDAKGAEFVPIASRPFVTHDLDLTTDAGIFALSSLPPVPDGAIVRVRYRATREQAAGFDTGDWRRQLLDEGAAVVKIQPDIVRATRARVEGLDEHVDDGDAFSAWLDGQDLDPATRTVLLERAGAFIGGAA